MNSELLIQNIVRQTMVFIAQLATAGGVRAPLAHLADQVFAELTRELLAQGLKKKVIADMFGLGLRTYHRRLQAAEQSKTERDRTVWEAVLSYLQAEQPVSGAQVLRRFSYDDADIVSGVLNDFVNSGLAYRAGRGEAAVYRIAAESDFRDETTRVHANEFLVWQVVFRKGPLGPNAIAEHTALNPGAVRTALSSLCDDQRIERVDEAEERYLSRRFEVPWGTTQGWEAAVLDHFQAMVSAITQKLSVRTSTRGLSDTVGGSTWTLDVWSGHPFEAEAKATLRSLREQVEQLRGRIDAYNAAHPRAGDSERVVVYVGQHLRPDAENHERNEAES